jgi:arabinose-5-phosphate isomerase
MTKNPVVISPDARMAEAIDILRSRKISELPVVDAAGRPVGMLDITDLIGLEPAPPAVETRPVLRLADRKSA